MSSSAAEPLPLGGLITYAWPPQPVLDPLVASALLAERLQAAVEDLEQERLRVLNGLGSSKGLTAQRLAAFVAEIETYMTRADYEVREYLRLHLQPRYEQGMAFAHPGGTVEWTVAHRTALTSLVTDTYADLLARSQEAKQVSEAFVRAVRSVAGEELPKAAAGGVTAVQAGDRLASTLLERYGVTTVTYANGAKVPVRAWARMAARTKSAVAYNAGSLNDWHQQGVGRVQVFDGPGCGWTSHADPDQADGSLRTLQEAASYVISHPNCRRAFGGRPDL